MKLRRRLLLLLVSALGGALVVLPAVAGSETSPSIEAVNSGGGYYKEEHRWSPATAAVTAGGTVMLSNPGSVPHGVNWVGGPATPTCTSGVPVGSSPAASGAKWSGACMFSQPGTYTFYCTVHGAEMTGTITVNAPTPGPTSPSPPSPSPNPTPHEPTPEGGPTSPLEGGSHALRLAANQRGSSVHGSVKVSQAGVGGRLEVELLAKSASLAKARSARVRVGRLVRSSLHAGTVSFAVPLSARVKGALHRHHRLALTVKVVLTPPHGSAATVSRAVVLHA